MHISLDSALGQQRRLNQVGETISSIAAPTAAYSLRSLTGGDPDVVQVRRSSDNAEEIFTASQVTSGALTSFVGSGNDGFVSIWFDQAGSSNATQSDDGDEPKIVSSGNLVDLDSDGIPAVDFTGGKYLVFSAISAKTVVGVNHLTSTTSLNYLIGKNLGDGGVRTASGNGIFQGADCPTSQTADFNNSGGSTHMNGSQSSFLSTTKNVYFGTATSGNLLSSIGTGFEFPPWFNKVLAR